MIRKLELRDIDDCVNICNENFNLLGYSYDVRKDFNHQFENQIIDLEFYVFEEDNIIKGVAGLSNTWFDNSVFGLCTCYIKPEFQGNGIGRVLTEHRINRIRELGGEVIFATTKQEWHLKRFGFEPINHPYDDWILMQLIIYEF